MCCCTGHIWPRFVTMYREDQDELQREADRGGFKGLLTTNFAGSPNAPLRYPDGQASQYARLVAALKDTCHAYRIRHPIRGPICHSVLQVIYIYTTFPTSAHRSDISRYPCSNCKYLNRSSITSAQLCRDVKWC